MESERKALLKFKDTISHGSDGLISWEAEDCCKWDRVFCNNLTGQVTNLDLIGFNLAGKLDASICELQHVTSLNLDDNYIRGEIPKCIGLLGKMKELHLNGNELVGILCKSAVHKRASSFPLRCNSFIFPSKPMHFGIFPLM
ncbi:receptor-like protein 11 [Vicia villosa]|uniref:receptor-like protein 11 n=1 Tax=Vicia villosa TaxID=3911 RepID=UPI00273BF5C1|nr:receptor-like protein 11 [Vicia villosa]